jgi:aminoglycoside phosphotransferase family enzyme
VPEHASRTEPDLELAAKVAFLGQSCAYPDKTSTVEVKETHMSWVFLTRLHAYKLKKPVQYPFLDFTTIEARRANCERELRLNRRLAPDVYLGVVALCADAEGKLQLGGPGRVVDWLVKMRRLPAERTLENAIVAGTVQEKDVRQLSKFLTNFYRSATSVPMEPGEYHRHFERDIREIREELERPGFGLPRDLVVRLGTDLLSFLAARGDVLEGRAGWVVECHGDLRPEHLYLGQDPVVLDCLEFNLEFRTLDPVDELAYLAMESDRLGAPFIEAWVFDFYRGGTGDTAPRLMVDFYKCYRAYLRAQIAIWHLNEPDIQTPEKWRGRALQYLALAQGYLARIDRW